MLDEIQLEHVNRVGTDAAPDWPAFRFTDGSGRDAAAAGCLATGMRALNAAPAVNDLSRGWVAALDLPRIPGVGAIRW
jgi:4-hydroxy-tetrahydrodipicolinate reductase